MHASPGSLAGRVLSGWSLVALLAVDLVERGGCEKGHFAVVIVVALTKRGGVPDQERRHT
jgi:hypothetical protein